MKTHTTLISQKKIAGSKEYIKRWLGVKVVYTTWEGERMVGAIETFEGCRPIIRFSDGRWAFGTLRVEVVDA